MSWCAAAERGALRKSKDMLQVTADKTGSQATGCLSSTSEPGPCQGFNPGAAFMPPLQLAGCSLSRPCHAHQARSQAAGPRRPAGAGYKAARPLPRRSSAAPHRAPRPRRPPSAAAGAARRGRMPWQVSPWPAIARGSASRTAVVSSQKQRNMLHGTSQRLLTLVVRQWGLIQCSKEQRCSMHATFDAHGSALDS